ncbi:ABC transporter ATP-binding protein [Antarcticimicrobium luteum]|uniref:ATP-binding cassette domain-containing protein n=1 Tax=Antarcticimicrobium luteum TaxID=2547397 RepID=A0A4R5UQ80_9RHOB|nr:ATP-binding cassette domain-containing protein [Antarcticimicrobium luteum]TDK41194.1 ATP-binding cassette domain-containing protein [Antarcticimicrobium luteum]
MLRLDHLVKKFGGLTATNDVTLDFPAGTLSAIIGPNGAGKTTLFNQITGHLVPTSGKIVFAGEDITGMKPAAIVRKGIGRAFQVANIFPTMTVEEALASAVSAHAHAAFELSSAFPRRDVKTRTEELLALLGMEPVARRISGEISHGDQKLLDVGLALALDPKLLLLDEPAAGMGPEERWQMMDTVQRLWKSQNMTLIFIEHDIDLVFRTAEIIHVLRYGAVLASGQADEIRGNPEVIEAYLGSETDATEADSREEPA